LWPQLTAILSGDIPGLALVKSEMISAGGIDVCDERLLSAVGIAMDL